MLLLTLLALSGCQTAPIAIDAGCRTWERYGIKPSRADTEETARGLFVLNEAMTAACR